MGEVECCHCQGWPRLAEINFSNLSVCLGLGLGRELTSDTGDTGGHNTVTNYHRVALLLSNPPTDINCMQFWSGTDKLVVKTSPSLSYIQGNNSTTLPGHYQLALGHTMHAQYNRLWVKCPDVLLNFWNFSKILDEKHYIPQLSSNV